MKFNPIIEKIRLIDLDRNEVKNMLIHYNGLAIPYRNARELRRINQSEEDL